MKKRKVDNFTWGLASFSSLIIILPLAALFFKVPWSTFFQRLSEADSWNAIRLSLWSSSLAALIALFLGLPLAWVLARGSDRFTNLLRPLVLAPIVLPPTVGGVALLALLGRNGLLGRYIYQWSGWAMPFTSVAVVFVGIFVGLPFVVLVLESTFRKLPLALEDAAVIDRAPPRAIFLQIALPQSRNGIATALVMAWARAVGEFGATMMFAGSLPGVTQTWPLQVYLAMDFDSATAFTLSAAMVLLAFMVIFLLRKQLRQVFR